jgi:hypothetical protein
MKKLVFIILIGLFSIKSEAQRVEVLRKSDMIYKKYNTSRGFYFLDSSIDNKDIKYVASIRAKLKKNILNNNTIGCFESVYYFIKNKAGDLGANSFKLDSFYESDTSKYMTLTIDAFFSPDSIIKFNKQLKEKNTLYAFPRVNIRNDSTTFNFDKQQIKLYYKQYFKYNLKVGEIARVNKGGIAGEQRSIEGVANRPAVYLEFTGLNPFNITTGNIEEKDPDEGEFLMKVCFKKQITLDSNRKAVGY